MKKKVNYCFSTETSPDQVIHLLVWNTAMLARRDVPSVRE